MAAKAKSSSGKKDESKKTEAWPFFDHIVSDAAPEGVHTNPWVRDEAGGLRFEPDYEVLEKLLGVPLYLKAATTTGVPALALDVWLSYELRRAGFDDDQVWPRASHPRVLPAAIAAFIKSLTIKQHKDVAPRVFRPESIRGVTSATANILGKNYTKQVDVVISDWATGPELLISTKRMDSSYGNNAANRVEESYGDAKNLRLRHPLAALGFVYGLRSDIFQKAPDKAEWLFDLLAKLGREDDAYHATCLVLIDYENDLVPPGDNAEPDTGGILEPGPSSDENGAAEGEAVVPTEKLVSEALKSLPRVTILRDRTPPELAPGLFLASMVTRVISATPVNMHTEARKRRATPRSPSVISVG